MHRPQRARRTPAVLLSLIAFSSLTACDKKETPGGDDASVASDANDATTDTGAGGAGTDAAGVDAHADGANGDADAAPSCPGSAGCPCTAADGSAIADGQPCEDGRVCTVGDVCTAGVCTSGAQACPCEPGFLDCAASEADDASNKCKGPPTCLAQPKDAAVPYICAPNPGMTKVCDDSLDDTCVKNACAPLAGSCTLTAVERTEAICDLPPKEAGGAPTCRLQVRSPGSKDGPTVGCDDGLLCSAGDSCKGGACTPASLAQCGCTEDADCVDDGDLCNGLPYCDKSAKAADGSPKWVCAVNQATVVSCDTSGDGPCEATACDAGSGACKKTPKPKGTACSDDVACTEGDICDGASKCQSGTWTCCTSDADCAKEEDGDLCNGTLFCNQQKGACELNPATVVVCPSVDDTTCTKSICQKATGQCAPTPVNIGLPCDDGNACSDLDTCDDKGQCVAGKDTCPCVNDDDCKAKDDGDLCNGTLYCNPIAGPDGTGVCRPNPKTVVTCPTVDDTACSKNRCDKKTGLCGVVNLPTATTCNADDTACTAGDACDGQGGCAVGMPVCECLSDADCQGKDDGDLCNGTLYCDKSGPKPVCKLNAATVKVCPSVDNTACKQNVCVPKTGACMVKVAPAGAPCEDGELCTAGDACDGKGSCNGGGTIVCGCTGDEGCANFDDGDVCNGAYVCVGKSCQFNGKALACDDDDPCTDDSCDKAKGCVNAAKAGCATCATKADCDDGNACTVDLCASKQCFWEAGPVECDDGDACTEGDACAGTTCQPGPAKSCDDGNLCTLDSCDKATGCIVENGGLSCSDGDACTDGDTCKSGNCLAGGKKDCDDKTSCTLDTCDSKVGCKHDNLVDGSGCSEEVGGTCDAGTCKPAPCPVGYDAVTQSDSGGSVVVCTATGPVWGARPVQPKGVYSVSAPGLASEKVVSDSQTKLMWQQNAAATAVGWEEAKSACAELVYAGFTDWRLPTAAEGHTLLDYLIEPSKGPCIDQTAFPFTANDYIWTGTATSSSASYIWTIHLNGGSVFAEKPAGNFHYQCVRTAGTVAAASPRFTINTTDKTVADAWQSLLWQREIPSTEMSWDPGKTTCADLVLAGKNDWRLPTVRELYGLVDLHGDKQAIDALAFPNFDASKYFASSTARAGSSQKFWAVKFEAGTVGERNATTDAVLVRCVHDLP